MSAASERFAAKLTEALGKLRETEGTTPAAERMLRTEVENLIALVRKPFVTARDLRALGYALPGVPDSAEWHGGEWEVGAPTQEGHVTRIPIRLKSGEWRNVVQRVELTVQVGE